MKRFFRAVALISGALACGCLAAPEPAVVPAPGQWTVNVEFTHPQQIVLGHSPDGRPNRFWYTIITLTNNTGHDVDFYPRCDLMTDNFQIIPAGTFVSGLVFEQIKKRHSARYPFIEPLEKAGKRLLEGEDNATDIAVIWPDFDARATKLKIFITGLSNETAVVYHPVLTDDATGEPVRVFLRKTLELNYGLRSDPALRSDAGLIFESKRWIMR